MKSIRIVLIGSLVLICQASFSQTVNPASTAVFAPQTVTFLKGFLQRIVQDKASQFEIVSIPPEDGKDVFELESRPAAAGGPERIILRGMTYSPSVL